MTGRFLGAGDADAARAAGRRMIEWSILAGVVVGLLLAVTSPSLPDLFSDDPEVIALAGFLILLVAALQPLNGLVFALDGILIGAGDMAFLAKAMVFAFLVFAPAILVVLFLDLGIGWVWAAIALLFLARAIPLSARFAGDGWIRLGAD
jgi:Na+-driven multidrug efflux pump